MNTNTQQTQIATIISCALLDEASQPGTFNQKLDEACKINNLPIVKYNLEPNTAQNFFAAITGSQKINRSQVINRPRSSVMKQDTQDRNSLKQINLEKIKRREEETQLKPNQATLQEASIGTGIATIEDLKILQQNLENNQLIIKTMGKQVETKEKITTLDKLSTILNHVEVFSNPEWIEEIRKATKLLISAGFSKKEIKINYKQEPETREQFDKSPGRVGDLIFNTYFFQNDLVEADGPVTLNETIRMEC